MTIPPIKPEQVNKAVVLSESEIMGNLRQNQKINCIKWLRSATSMGLKEAKDAIEALYETGRLDEQRAKEYLAPCFAKPEQPKLEPQMDEVTTAVLNGMMTVIHNWEALGYDDPFTACRDVLDKLECKTKEVNRLHI
jgi:hypothetical protein